MKTEKNYRKKLMAYVIIAIEKTIWVKTVEKENKRIKKYEKAEKAIDGDEENLVICLLTMVIKKETIKKKVWFAEGIKKPMEAGMICTIDVDTFFAHKEHMDWRLWCIMSHHEQLYQSGALGTCQGQKRNLHINVWQVDDTEWVHTLWQVKFHPKAGASQFSFCKLLQGKQLQVTTEITL